MPWTQNRPGLAVFVSAAGVTDHFDEHEKLMHDGNIESQAISAKAAEKLRGRFLDRIALMVSGEKSWNAPTIAMMREDAERCSVEIWLCRSQTSSSVQQGLSHEQQALFSTIERALSCIRQYYPHGCKQELKDLWEAVLRCYESRLQVCVQEIRKTFDEHKKEFEDLVSSVLGIFDDVPSDVDLEMGNLVICLRNKVCTPGSNEFDKEDIVTFAFSVVQLPHWQTRLRNVLGKSSFATPLYPHICTLARPKYAFDTFVRIARVSKSFCVVKLRPGTPPAPSRVPGKSVMPPSRCFGRSYIPPKTLSCGRRLAANDMDVSKRYHAAGATPVQDPVGDFFNNARPYLPLAERQLGPIELQPEAKSQAFFLLAALLKKCNPDPKWPVYYLCGYPTCRNPDEGRYLGSIYLGLLNGRGERTAMFAELWQALEKNALVQLLDKYGCSLFCETIPNLVNFLRTPPSERQTVWRLVQFVRAQDDMYPSPCLLRDYGFQFCKQREEMQRLKEIYSQMLKKADPDELHSACRQGRLYEFGIARGIPIQPHERRLMQNASPSPSLGFDDGVGTRGFARKFFKK